MFNGTGRVQYSELIQLYKTSTNSTTKFTTYFQFSILFTNSNYNTSSGGFTFFLSPENTEVPKNSVGGYLGPFNEAIDGDPSNHMLAMEFDTYKNQLDPSNNHVGINVNSVVSKVSKTWDHTMTSGDTLAATISYLETSKTLSVHLKDPLVLVETGLLNLSYKVDLKEIFLDKVVVGFSASIGNPIVVQKITMWNFTLSLNDENDYENNVKSWHMGLAIAIGVLLLLFIYLCYRCYRSRCDKTNMEEDGEEEEEENDLKGESMHEYFTRGTRPKRFTYKELALATNIFSEEGKLGQEGFGEVYKGFLTSLNMEVAVKKNL